MPEPIGETVQPQIINLTPHTVAIRGPRGEVVLPSEGVVRIVDRPLPVGDLGTIDLFDVTFGEVAGLPEPRPGVLLLVSRIVAQARPDRWDLVFPFGEIRDDAGRILAVSALARVAPGGRVAAAVEPERQ